ncbi:MAG TPA: tetratricopeptide repeat protein [Longimicrobiales bacterium]|nr:tetratricopeptide repeat protein [Longimicrobiales bacterium]
MKRLRAVLLACLLVPAAVQAQRPSNSVHIRTAETYFADAARPARTPAERAELYRKALDAALLGVQADAGNPRHWFVAGRAYVRLNDLAGADSAFDRAEQIWPDYVTETEPERLNAWIGAYNAGVAAVQSGDIAAAIAALEGADRIYRKRPEALVTLGSIYMQTGDHARAEQTFRAALTVLSGDRSALKPQELAAWQEDELAVALRLATLYVDQGRNEEAEQVYRDLLARQPGNTMAKSNLAVVLSRIGRLDEAAAIYRELLATDELAEGTLFNIGIGMFRTEAWADAAAAFRRAAKFNPHSHDTLYNLAQAVFALTAELEKEKAGAAAARAGEIDAQLRQLNEEMRAVAETLRGIDPTNRNVHMMLAQAQRSLAELSTGAAADELRRQALATLEAHKALPFEVSELTVVPGTGEYQLIGRVTNLTLTAGSTIRIRFIVVNREGAELAAEEVTVTAPEKEESTRLMATLRVPDGAAAWKYVVIR